jgi:seryl-tRNA synthetase
MHDLKALRADPEGFDAAMKRRGISPISDKVLGPDVGKRRAQTQLQEIQAGRNALDREIAQAKRNGNDSTNLELESLRQKLLISTYTITATNAEGYIKEILDGLPNILDPDVPDGRDESDNLVLKNVGAPRNFDFTLLQHFELGEKLGQMEFERAAKLAGSRFTVLRGGLARLERALGQFMIDLHSNEHGYQETSVPLLVNEATMYGTGQLPKFKEDLFQTTDGRYLIPTAEVPLTNLVAGEIIPAAQLPIRLTALSECFRSEAGSAGRDTRGMLRQHQFRKVEMVSVTAPDASDAEHERMTRAAETVLERLELPYRRMLLCAGDTGFSAAKTYDLEVWLPGQGAWREISSCSNCRDFQARRMNARMRGADGKSILFPHTLNGSGVAVGRALIAVMENHQQADGSIRVPEVLWPYMGGVREVKAG